MPLKLPPLRPIHQLEIYWDCIRSQPALTPYSSVTIGMSWPVPGAHPDSLTGFLYRVDAQAQPPMTDLLVRFTGQFPACHLTEVLPGQASDSVAYFPETERSVVPSADYSRYYAALGDLLPAYAARSSPGTLGEEFEGLLWQMELQCLMPLYHALNPDFFGWLRNTPSVL
jgi:hypothetical protein